MDHVFFSSSFMINKTFRSGFGYYSRILIFFFLRIVSIRSISDWIWKSGCSLAIHSWKKTPDNSETGRIFYLPAFTQLLIGLEFQGQDVSRGYVNFMKRGLKGGDFMMQILGLFNVYFDGVIVFFTSHSLFFRLNRSDHTTYIKPLKCSSDIIFIFC